MFQSRRKTLSQNFLHNRTLVDKLVRSSSIGTNDLVLDIGAGKGIITESLAQVSQKVIAIEVDDRLIGRLKKLGSLHTNIEVNHIDFMNYALPTEGYKVFANIPFSIEGKIIRKLLHAENSPHDTYLIVRKDLAVRFLMTQKSTKISVMHAPWFEFSIHCVLKRTDFTPYARMDTVMVRFQKRKNPMLDKRQMKAFYQFIETGFRDGRPLRRSLSQYASRGRLDQIASQLNFSPKWTPSKLSLERWIGLFEAVTKTHCSGKMR